MISVWALPPASQGLKRNSWRKVSNNGGLLSRIPRYCVSRFERGFVLGLSCSGKLVVSTLESPLSRLRKQLSVVDSPVS